MVRRSRWLGGVAVAVAVAITACASIVGVEDAKLDPTFGMSEDAPASSGSSSGDPGNDAAAPEGDGARAVPPCAGEGCKCGTSEDCIDPIFSACHNGQCRECATSPDSCPADQFCETTTLSCVPGCKSEASCAGKHCDPFIHRCVECLTTLDCGGSKVCSFGVCADTCAGTEAGGGCPTGSTCCNGVCADTKSDRGHCGGCNASCSGATQLCCGGSCVDTATDKANCGNCATSCVSVNGTPTCNGGSCKWSCTTGFSHCTVGNSGCETLTNSATQCGGCAIDCNAVVAHASPKTCASGKCSYTSCDPSYADGNGNRADGCEAPCGANGQACCPRSPGCVDMSARCDKPNNKCVACLTKFKLCDPANDLCCNFCNPDTNKCG